MTCYSLDSANPSFWTNRSSKTSATMLRKITEAADTKKILLTFHGVQFMSSAMLGKLVIFGKKCREAGVDLKLCNIPDGIMEVFKITKMNKAFDIYKDEEKGLKAFNKKGWFG